MDCPTGDSPTLFDSFGGAALDGTIPITDGVSARTTTELICGILLAGLRRQAIAFPVDRAAFDELMDELIQTYQLGCAEALIDYALFDTATPFDAALSRYLVQRKKIG